MRKLQVTAGHLGAACGLPFLFLLDQLVVLFLQISQLLFELLDKSIGVFLMIFVYLGDVALVRHLQVFDGLTAFSLDLLDLLVSVVVSSLDALFAFPFGLAGFLVIGLGVFELLLQLRDLLLKIHDLLLVR